MSTQTSDEELQVRRMVESWAGAIRAKDVDRVLSHYAGDVVTFDLAPPLEYAGAEALAESLRAWFPTFRGPLGYELRDLHVTAGKELAFCRSLNRISGSRTDGARTDVWVRVTLGCRKTGDAWKIVHEHTSVPFYMDGSYKAAVDLKP